MSFEYNPSYRRKLPHIHPPGATFFVTFRLAGSVPKVVLEQWKSEKQWLEHELKRVSREAKETNTIESLNHQARLNTFHRRWFRKFEEILHRANHGPTWLKDEGVAKLVADSLRHRDGQVFRLDAYCIMSNHVHTVMKPFLAEDNVRVKLNGKKIGYESTEPPLRVIMHSLKSYTANEANKLLKRSGAFWETESYDHVIKDENEYYRTIAYVLNNPVKAGLVRNWRDWPWSHKRDQENLT